MSPSLTFSVTAAWAGLTVEQLLKQQGFSKKAISRLKNSPRSFSLNGHRVNSDHVLRAGDILSIPLDDQQPPAAAIVPWEQSLTVVYDDEYFSVVDKPAGLPMYPHTKGGSGSLANIWAWHHPGQIFHALTRLDENTAGLVIIAKSAFILHRLQQQNIEKYYLLYAQGELSGDGLIDLPLTHLNGRPRVFCDPNGKEARTAYQTLRPSPEQSLVRAHLLTGRTHQIRAHFAALGHPLCGDSLYDSTMPPPYRLLAYQLCFTHPLSGEILELESPAALCF